MLLGRVPADPFVREVVAVPTAGVERWLAQSLSLVLGARGGRRDGVVANVDFPTSRAVVERAVGQAVGADPAVDPWAAPRLVWPLLAVVDQHLDEPWLVVLARHLQETAGEGGVARRLGPVRHLARLFDGYATHRPGMLRAWASGTDVDGSGRALPPAVAWQAELWRRVAARVGVPGPETRTDEAVARLRSDAAAVDLPDRLALFGLTRLPPAHLEVLDALATHRDVHLFLLHPSPALWDRLAQAPAPTSPCRVPAAVDGVPCNRLLGSWGRDTRELQQVLRGVPDAGPAVSAADVPPADPRPPAPLLHRLQADIAADAPAPAPGPPAPGAPDPRPLLATGDRSVQVHACHGRARQVEVLRDAILHELAADPTLEPRDVIVLCPDIEQFAPLVRATFGAVPGEADGAPDLRLRLADRALRQTNPVLGTMDRVLELAGGRLTAPDILDLADRAPVRERFGLTDDDLARAGEWVSEAQVRWGLDARHRGQAGLEQVGANTWRRGLDRVLLGVATTEDAHVLLGDALPLDDVGSTEIDLAGRLAELLDRLDDVVARFATPRTLEAWADELARAADLLCAVPDADAWQRSALDGLLQDRVAESGGPGGSSSTLALAELRDLLADHLRGRPSRANFRTGHLTVCTMQPMRSVPHRVVCLLGLDDGAFPRAAARDGDDLLLADPHVGDPDPRSEDRQLLLDALLSAEDRLIVTYGGADERTNSRRPPAVPVGELLDVIDATVRVDPDGDATRTARDVIVTEHPLQPFDPRTFRDGALGTDGPFGFDRVALSGARALEAQRAAGPPTGGGRPFLSARLAPATDD